METKQVLPWGNLPISENVELAETIDVDVPVTLALPEASRIEVKWEVDIENEAQAEVAASVKWWGASIVGKVEGEHDGEGRQCYQIRYDAEDGFDEELRLVTFLDEHILYDLADDEELLWRREGEEWDEEPEGEDGERTVELCDVVAAISQAERRRGRTVEEDCMDLVKDLPVDQQCYAISKFTDFAETLSLEIKELAQSKGPGYVVTAVDVRLAQEKAMQQCKAKAAHALR